MKNNFIFVILIILLFLPAILYVNIVFDFQELKREIELQQIIYEQNNQEKENDVQELKKEIRILQQDILILQNGFIEE